MQELTGFSVLLGAAIASWGLGYFVGKVWGAVERVTRDAIT